MLLARVGERELETVRLQPDANMRGIYYLADGRLSSGSCLMLHLPSAIGLKLKAISIPSHKIFSASTL